MANRSIEETFQAIKPKGRKGIRIRRRSVSGGEQ